EGGVLSHLSGSSRWFAGGRHGSRLAERREMIGQPTQEDQHAAHGPRVLVGGQVAGLGERHLGPAVTEIAQDRGQELDVRTGRVAGIDERERHLVRRFDLAELARERDLDPLRAVVHRRLPGAAWPRVHLTFLERDLRAVLSEPGDEVLRLGPRIEDELAGRVEDPDDRDAAGIAGGGDDARCGGGCAGGDHRTVPIWMSWRWSASWSNRVAQKARYCSSQASASPSG